MHYNRFSEKKNVVTLKLRMYWIDYKSNCSYVNTFKAI